MGVSLSSPRFLSNGWGPPHIIQIDLAIAQLKALNPILKIPIDFAGAIIKNIVDEGDNPDEEIEEDAKSWNPALEAMTNFQLAEDRSGWTLELLRAGKADEAERMAQKAGAAYARHLNALNMLAGVAIGAAGAIKAATTKGAVFIAALRGKNTYESEKKDFDGLIDLKEFESDPNIIARTSKGGVRHGDIGGYSNLQAGAGEEKFGKIGDRLDSHEIVPNAKIRMEKDVERTSTETAKSPSVALRKQVHSDLKKPSAADLESKTPQELAEFQLDQLKDVLPEYVLNTLRKEVRNFIKYSF